MDLVKDISKAKTHFMAITLRRTASSNPRTYYTLVDYEIIPFSWIEEVWSARANIVDSSQVSPKIIRDNDEAERKSDGALGSVLIMSCELPPGNNQSVREALKSVRIYVISLG